MKRGIIDLTRDDDDNTRGDSALARRLGAEEARRQKKRAVPDTSGDEALARLAQRAHTMELRPRRSVRG